MCVLKWLAFDDELLCTTLRAESLYKVFFLFFLYAVSKVLQAVLRHLLLRAHSENELTTRLLTTNYFLA